MSSESQPPPDGHVPPESALPPDSASPPEREAVPPAAAHLHTDATAVADPAGSPEAVSPAVDYSQPVDHPHAQDAAPEPTPVLESADAAYVATDAAAAAEAHHAEPSPPPPSSPAPDPTPAYTPPPSGPVDPKAPAAHDPEEFRMTVGEHLEELRNRLFLGVAGFFVAFVICMIIGEKVVYTFCRPLLIALARNKLEPHIYFTEAAEPFMTYIKISMISAATLAGPWILYQIWQFVAAGLYPHERKYVTKYLPLSIILLITGMLFLYFYVLPLMLQFFIKFTIGGALPMGDIFKYQTTATTQPIMLPILKDDPVNPGAGSLWLNATTGFIKIAIGNGELRVLNFGSESVTTPMITLATYIDMVVEMLLAFGLSFQLPLVVLALNKIGILSIEALKSWRRVVYFSLTIISAFVVPDVATGMVALLVPLILLYELGILLAGWGKKKEESGAAV